VPTFVAAIDR